MKKLKLWFKAIAVALLSFITAPAYADLSEILASGKVKIGVGENFAPFSSLGYFLNDFRGENQPLNESAAQTVPHRTTLKFTSEVRTNTYFRRQYPEPSGIMRRIYLLNFNITC